MIYSIWLYRFKPGLTDSTLIKLRELGPERMYPGVVSEGGTFLGRIWGHFGYTYGSVFRRDGVAGVRAEAEDTESLVRTLRVLSPALEAMEVRNLIPRDNPELVALGDDEWHRQAVSSWVQAARANPEIAYHLDVIGFSCFKRNTFAPYMVQAVWRDRLGFPQQWFGGKDARTHFAAPAEIHQRADAVNGALAKSVAETGF